MSLHPHGLSDWLDPGTGLDPVLFGVLTAAMEQESVLAYEAGFSDGLRTARYRAPFDEEDPLVLDDSPGDPGPNDAGWDS
jgi:hypothetical protein